MLRRIASLVLVAALALGLDPHALWAQDALKVIQMQKSDNLVVTHKSASGQWTQGRNDFVLEFASGEPGKAADVGKATLSTSMPMPGMAPMIAGATLSPDGPGRYKGTISFPDRGARQVTVSWDGAAGRGSTRFSVPVR
jgi:hypothetical protein